MTIDLNTLILILLGGLGTISWWFTTNKVTSIDRKLDALPEQFAQVHKRVSEAEAKHENLKGKFEAHAEAGKSGK